LQLNLRSPASVGPAGTVYAAALDVCVMLQLLSVELHLRHKRTDGRTKRGTASGINFSLSTNNWAKWQHSRDA